MYKGVASILIIPSKEQTSKDLAVVLADLGLCYLLMLYLRNRSALAVNCCVIIHCLEVSCKEDQITSAQRFGQLTDKQ